ncbi:MAG: hypothetical protein IJ240_10020 [Clostridia bacterium]|nr:hypothetical protein [Clostridia bacterium]
MKRIISVTLSLVLLLSLGLARAELTSSDETQSLQKAYYDADYAYLNDEDSVFSSVTLEEAYTIFQQEGNYLFLLGGSWCGNTTPVIGYINEVAKEYGVQTIYNLDFRLDGVNRSSHIRETAGAQSQGAVLSGSLYNYLYGEIVTRWLTNLNDYVEYKVDTESALTYTDAAGQSVTVPKVQVPFVFLYNKDHMNDAGEAAPIVAGLELMKVRSDFAAEDGAVNEEAVAEYKATLRASVFDAVRGVTLTPFTDADYIRIIYNEKAGQEIFAPDAQINLETVTYRQLQWLLGQEGDYLILFAGSWCPNTQAIISIVNDFAVANHVTVYTFDTKLDSGYARKYWGYEKDLHIRDSANEFASLYVDLVLDYLPNIETEYTIENGNFISYVNADGETVAANKLQVPYFLAYTKGLEDENGHFVPVTAAIEKMLTLNPDREDYVGTPENHQAYVDGAAKVLAAYASRAGIEAVTPEY